MGNELHRMSQQILNKVMEGQEPAAMHHPIRKQKK
jgi:hypothetical protein